MSNRIRWTEDQIKTLCRVYKSGMSYRNMAEATGKSEKQVNDKAFRLGLRRKWQTLEEYGSLGHLDIEATQLTANFGFMLSWAIKVDKGIILSDKLNEEDYSQKNKINADKRIVTSLSNALSDFDVITHFFGDYFDIPFIRSRCLKHNVPFPEYGSLYTIDVWRWAKRNLKLHSNRLESVSQYFGVNSKTKLDPDIWVRATMGDTEALEEIAYHNEQDVITLEKVYHKLKPYSSGAKRSI